MEKKEQRNSSIELLRIITMMGVIVLHYNKNITGGALEYVVDGSLNQYYLFVTETIFICAVDLFVMISAYFLCATKKRNIIKVFELIIQVIVFRMTSYLLMVFIGENEFTIKNFLGSLLPTNYFVILYAVLYIISPYINLLIENLDKKTLKRLITWLIVIFSVWTILVDFLENIHGGDFNGLSTVGMYGSQYGYSIVNFIVIYFVGSYIRVNQINIKKKQVCILLLCVLFVLYLSALLEHKIGLSLITTWNYNNPLIILFATLVILLFININFHNKVINELARGGFTCFLFHGYIVTRLPINNIVNKSIFVLIGHQMFVTISLYFTSYILYKIYTLCTNKIVKMFIPICSKINISLD